MSDGAPLPADPRERLMALWRSLYDGLAAHSSLPEVLARRRPEQAVLNCPRQLSEERS